MKPLDFIFPKRCVNCGNLGSYFCKNCQKLLVFIEEQICPVCEKRAISGKTHYLCQTVRCLDGLISVLIYKDPVKEIIYQLKYKFTQDLAGDLINILISRKPPLILSKKMILVPLPLHWFRENWRGFNQSEILGKLLAEKLKIGFQPQALTKKLGTKEQVHLESKERRKNVANVFEASGVRGKEILLFDDVWTTGATLKSAATELKRKGAKIVWGFTLAR